MGTRPGQEGFSPATRTLLWVLAVAALFRLPGLGYPHEEYFDEVYHAKTAQQYLLGEPPTEWVHPPTSKLLIAVGVHFFGYRPWAWRLAPAFAGIALAGVFLLLARRVLPSERAARIATAILLCDGVYLVQSRVAMTNVFAVLFQLLAALFLLHAADRARLRLSSMSALGLALGLALSTRWTSLWACGLLGLVFLWLRVHHHRSTAAAGERPRTGVLVGEAALALTAFALIPAALYLLSYLPWMLQTHPQGLAAWKGRIWEVVTTQREIWRYHATLNATHTYFSAWWTWPFLYRPTWYSWVSDSCCVRGIIALGNPAIWWLSVPAALWAVVSGVRARDARRVFAGTGFFMLYLPWGLSPRTLNFSHYLFEAIPYACLALAAFLDRIWDGRWRTVAISYLGVVAALFLWFLPFFVGLPVWLRLWGFRLGGWGLWTWFASWI